METNFELTTPATATAVFPEWQPDATIQARVVGAQQLLFASSPRAICDEIGLNWWAAVKLYDDGWLTFSPDLIARLDEAQEAELRFLGTLVAAGCDRRMLVTLLRGLTRPYSYDLHRLYFDWSVQSWRMLPDSQAHPESCFTDWLESLVQDKDVSTLTGIIELTHDALSKVSGGVAQPDLKRG